jgi:hypothetical protein
MSDDRVAEAAVSPAIRTKRRPLQLQYRAWVLNADAKVLISYTTTSS